MHGVTPASVRTLAYRTAGTVVISLSLLACSGEEAATNTASGAIVTTEPVAASTAAPTQSSDSNQVVVGSSTSQTDDVDSKASLADVESLYQKTCISCHLSGAAGAPRSHDVAAWSPRMAKGMDVMVASIKNGLNAMPPKGLCFNCTDEQYEALVLFMANPKS